MAVEGIRNIIFGLQITSAVKDLPTKDDLIRLGALPSPTAEHHEFTQEEGEREKGNRSSRNQLRGSSSADWNEPLMYGESVPLRIFLVLSH